MQAEDVLPELPLERDDAVGESAGQAVRGVSQFQPPPGGHRRSWLQL